MIDPILAHLPQKDAIQPEDAQRWLRGMSKYHSDRIDFHLRRLEGFGGSEAGAIARGVNGKPVSGFSSLERIVEQKLLKRLPDFQTSHMERGIVLEELARLAFMYRYEAARDVEALSAINNAPKDPRCPWLQGNADDVTVLAGKRFLIDFKVPSTFDELVDEDYVYQLHHYGLIARFASVPIDGYLLTKLDLAPELAHSLVAKFPAMSAAERHQLAKTIAMADVPGMRVVALGVPVDRNVAVDILDTCSFAWEEYVLKGVVPTPEPKPLIELDDAGLRHIETLQQQFVMAKGGISHLEAVAKEVQAKLAQALEGADLDAVSLPPSPLNVKRKGLDNARVVEEALARGAESDTLLADQLKYSLDALIEEIKRLNGDPEANHLYEQKLDPKKAADYLERLGVDLSEFQLPELSVTLSRKNTAKEALAAVEQEAGEVLGRWFDNHIEEDHSPFDDGLELVQDIEQLGRVDASGTSHGHDAGGDTSEEPTYPRNSGASMR